MLVGQNITNRTFVESAKKALGSGIDYNPQVPTISEDGKEANLFGLYLIGKHGLEAARLLVKSNRNIQNNPDAFELAAEELTEIQMLLLFDSPLEALLE